MKKFSIGDSVRISKKKSMYKLIRPGSGKNYLPNWFSNDIFTIKNIDKDKVTLDKNLPNDHGCDINIAYLKSLKKERKKKLLKLKNL